MTRDEALAELTTVGEPYELIERDAVGRRVRAFRNSPRNLRELYERGRSDATFIVYDDERLSFAEFWDRVLRTARSLQTEYGVGRGDRVAISMRNYPEWMVAFAAATSLGAIAVALNALWTADELAYAISDCEPKVLVVDFERLTRLDPAGPPAGVAVLVARGTGDLPGWARPFEALLDAGGEAPVVWPEIGPDDDAMILYTSGSTGRPKGVLSTHEAVLCALLSWELDGKAAVLTGAAPAPKPGAPNR